MTRVFSPKCLLPRDTDLGLVGWVHTKEGMGSLAQETEYAKDARTDPTGPPRFQNTPGCPAEGRVSQR